jgi:hypothetical protein
MTSQGSAQGRFQRAIQRRHLFAAEVAMREMEEKVILLSSLIVGLLSSLWLLARDMRRAAADYAGF